MKVQLGAALLAVGVLIGVGVVTVVRDDTSETPPMDATAGERGAPGHGIVFYSGQNEAGVAEADQYSDWEYVHNNRPLGITYSEWVKGDCATDGAATHPSDRDLHTLVGYSLGRLGPVYFLNHEARRGEIDTIWLLDPGHGDNMAPPGCDGRLATRPGQTLAEWLTGDDARRLIIISAESTNRDGRDGLKRYYLDDLNSAPPDVADRALLCIDTTTSHKAVPGVYMPLIHRNTGCPDIARSDGTGPLTGTAPSAPTPPERPGPAPAPAPAPGPAPAPAPAPAPVPAPAPAPAPVPAPAPAPPPPAAPATRTVTIHNKVTNGGTEMREDSPAYLSTVTRNICRRDGCALGGTDMNTGAQLTAVCQTTGPRTTNGEDGRAIDDANPGLFQTTRWYGARWHDGRFGYISEAWINPAHRGGLGLPGC